MFRKTTLGNISSKKRTLIKQSFMALCLMLLTNVAGASLNNDGVDCLRGSSTNTADWDYTVPVWRIPAGGGAAQQVNEYRTFSKRARNKITIAAASWLSTPMTTRYTINGVTFNGTGNRGSRVGPEMDYMGGCNPTQSVYGTRDCLDHDYCLLSAPYANADWHTHRKLNDTYCGDEFGHATGDVVLNLSSPITLAICATRWSR